MKSCCSKICHPPPAATAAAAATKFISVTGCSIELINCCFGQSLSFALEAFLQMLFIIKQGAVIVLCPFILRRTLHFLAGCFVVTTEQKLSRHICAIPAIVIVVIIIIIKKYLHKLQLVIVVIKNLNYLPDFILLLSLNKLSFFKQYS